MTYQTRVLQPDEWAAELKVLMSESFMRSFRKALRLNTESARNFGKGVLRFLYTVTSQTLVLLLELCLQEYACCSGRMLSPQVLQDVSAGFDSYFGQP